jgi:hypothetical protein
MQWGVQKLLQLGKDLCLPWATNGGRGEPKGSPQLKLLWRCEHKAHP